MNWSKRWKIFITLFTVIFIILEVWSIIDSSGRGTLSYHIVKWSIEHPFIKTFLVSGISALMAHFYWPATQDKNLIKHIISLEKQIEIQAEIIKELRK